MNTKEWSVGVVDYGGRLLLRARSKAGKVKHKTAPTDKRREAAKMIRLLSASGLRLGEAVALSWNTEDPVSLVQRDGRLWIVIAAEAQKAGRLTECPATPEFSDLLLSVPEGQRRGRVVKLPTRRVDNVSQVVADCCKAAQVRGTAHDLRRTFAERWAKKLSAQQLQKLMRHASLQTTLAYYATGNCGLEDALFSDLGNKVGNKATDCEVGK
jgi:integrase